MLFLNSHGVVLRIGPTDVTDLLNPGLLQPLGWLEDRKHMIGGIPFTIAIYPGIELGQNYNRSDIRKRPKLVEGLSLRELLSSTGQGSSDMSDENTGIMRVLNDEGKEVAVKVMLDIDNRFNSSSQELSKRRAASLEKHEKSSANKSDVLSRTLQDVFNVASDVKYWQRAFQQHQPLRHLFWEAFKTDVPDSARRTAFWDKCAQVTKRPEHAVVPVWRPQTDADGNTTYSRELVHIPNLVLYRPWTGKTSDKIIKALRKPIAIKEVVQQAHDKLEPQDEKLKAGFIRQSLRNLAARFC